jgi:hypothetical protein
MMIDFSNYFCPNPKCKEHGVRGKGNITTSTRFGRIKPICCVVRAAVKGFLRIVTQFLCTPIIAGKPSNALFWPLPNVTAFGGQQESLNWTRMVLTVLCSRPESIARKYYQT